MNNLVLFICQEMFIYIFSIRYITYTKRYVCVDSASSSSFFSVGRTNLLQFLFPFLMRTWRRFSFIHLLFPMSYTRESGGACHWRRRKGTCTMLCIATIPIMWRGLLCTWKCWHFQLWRCHMHSRSWCFGQYGCYFFLPEAGNRFSCRRTRGSSCFRFGKWFS